MLYVYLTYYLHIAIHSYVTTSILMVQVTEAHKRHGTPPHCIFAVDNLVHRAVNEVLSVVSPGNYTRT